jgi:hypothetical protein
VGGLIAGLIVLVSMSAWRRQRTGRWLLTREEWKASWSAERLSPWFWLFYAVFFSAVLMAALFLPGEASGWRIFEVAAFGALALVGYIQLVRSLRARRGDEGSELHGSLRP